MESVTLKVGRPPLKEHTTHATPGQSKTVSRTGAFRVTKVAHTPRREGGQHSRRTYARDEDRETNK